LQPERALDGKTQEVKLHRQTEKKSPHKYRKIVQNSKYQTIAANIPLGNILKDCCNIHEDVFFAIIHQTIKPQDDVVNLRK